MLLLEQCSKIPLSFHYTGRFIGIPLLDHYNLQIFNILGSIIPIIINQQRSALMKMRGEACNAATCFPQAHNHSRSFVISRYVAGSYRDAGDPTTRTGRGDDDPKKERRRKKNTPHSPRPKTIIPRLTPFWPLNGLNPSKRRPTASNWTGFS